MTGRVQGDGQDPAGRLDAIRRRLVPVFEVVGAVPGRPGASAVSVVGGSGPLAGTAPAVTLEASSTAVSTRGAEGGGTAGAAQGSTKPSLPGAGRRPADAGRKGG